MTPQEFKNGAKLAFIGGGIKLAAQLIYSIGHIKGVWYVGEIVSDVLFWLSFNIFFRTNPKYKATATAFLMLSVNDLLDQILFDPSSFGWNEKVFFTLIILWYIRSIRKCRRLKNG